VKSTAMRAIRGAQHHPLAAAPASRLIHVTKFSLSLSLEPNIESTTRWRYRQVDVCPSYSVVVYSSIQFPSGRLAVSVAVSRVAM